MKDRFAKLWCLVLLKAPGKVASALLLITAISFGLASQLRINTNQLELLDQDLRQVRNVKRVVDMIGGAGFLTLALRGNDPELLKKAADDIVADLQQNKDIRSAEQKLSTEFLKQRAALFMETEDLQELKKRVMVYVKDRIKRASPLYFEIKKTKPKELKLDDLMAKYEKVGKKRVADDYYLSKDSKLLLVRIKPMWDSNQLTETGELVEKLRKDLANYSKDGIRLKEDYSDQPSGDPKTIEFGFTGVYKTNFDDSFSIKNSLQPVSGLALLGVFIVLAFFFRQSLPVVFLVVFGLLMGIVSTFGFAKVSVGQLNMVTAILGGILLGIGIDFGIHLIYRLRYELSCQKPLEKAVEETIHHAGPASAASAAGIGAAFMSLLFSGFKGFSHFGLLASVGVILVGIYMYLWVPAILLLVDRKYPGSVARWLSFKKDAEVSRKGAIGRPGLWLAMFSLVAGAVLYFAPQVKFEYNTRALMVENQPAVLLQDEINRRFHISADPVAIYTKNLEETKEVHGLFTPLDKKRFSTVDQVVSIYSFYPSAEKQAANAKILEEWRQELSVIDRASLPPDVEKKWDMVQPYLNAKPFELNDIPEYYQKLFRHLPSAQPENHGYLTFVYPTVDLWDGKQMLAFGEQLETIEAPSGKKYHAAGLPILFAELANTIIFDGKFTVCLTAVFLVLILLVDLRSVRDTFIALIPLVIGLGVMMGLMAILDFRLNFMNVIVFPILLGYGVSHGVYLLHRVNEGVSPMEALRSVGVAVTCSTLTSLAGWAALLAAAHRGLKSMGEIACVGMLSTLLVSFTVMLPLLQILQHRRNSSSVEDSRA